MRRVPSEKNMLNDRMIIKNEKDKQRERRIRRRNKNFDIACKWCRTERVEAINLSHRKSIKKNNPSVDIKELEDERYLIPPDTTFLVLASRLGKVYVYRFNKAKSLWAFGPSNPIRKIIIYLITNQIFEFFVILTILVNCVFLALDDAPEEAEYVFTAIYTMEMILKIIAKGFLLHSFAYLRDPWNWLDFIVVLLGYVTLAPSMAVNFSGIRTFRVLRALRTISAIEGLKTMVNALLKSMRMLSDVLILTAFFICVFALVGLQLFSGQFHNKCVQSNITIDEENNITWSNAIRNSSNWYKSIEICGNNTGAQSCPTNYTCLPSVGPNPNFGYTSYDDFGWALLTSFQLVTLDYWENVYLHIASAMGPWYVIYFMIVVFFGSFYLINLVLAVVAVSYQQETAQNADLESQYEFLREVASSHSLHKRILPKLLFDDPAIDNISNLPCVRKGPSVIILSSGKKSSTRNNSNEDDEGVIDNKRKEHCFHNERTTNLGSPGAAESSKLARKKLTDIINRVKMERERENLRDKNNNKNGVHDNNNNNNNSNSSHIESGNSEEGGTKLNIANVRSSGKKLYLPTKREKRDLESGGGDGVGLPITNGKTNNFVRFNEENLNKNTGAVAAATSRARRLALNVDHPLPYAHVNSNDLTCVQMGRRRVYRFVMTPWFEIGVTIFILLNTICLAMEYHGMDATFRAALNITNHICTGIFISEMILKLIALGFFGYLKSKWNIFDGLVVILSVVDLIIELVSSSNNGEFTIIRSLRLFRVLKLAQSWSTMRLLLSAIGRSLNALGNLTLILGIILYMFAVVGTQVFGKQYTPEKFRDNKVPVWNFSNFGHSIMMIFRVLCGEWIEPLYECMLATGTWATAFYMPALVVGNFLVLNLFLALLLNSFADQAMEEELKKRSFIKSKLKWVSSTRKLAKLQKAFKGQKIFPNSELNIAAAAKLVMARKQENAKEEKEQIALDTTLESLTNGAADVSLKSESLLLDDESSSLDIPDGNAIYLPITDENNPTANGVSAQSLPATPTLLTRNQHPEKHPATPNGTANRQPVTSNFALHHKVNPLCLKLCCCLGNDDNNENNRAATPSLPLRQEEKQPTTKLTCCDAFRGKVKALIEHKWFDNSILVLIFASSIVLVFEDIHLSSKPELQFALYILNIVFSILFSIECILKVIGHGVKNYIKNPWNLLDFSIVVISITAIIMEIMNKGGNLKTLRSLRTLRALRPLRAVSRWDGMKIVVNSLLKAIPSIGNVLLVCLVFWLIFSILGVQFFGGKFYKCVDSEGQRLSATITPNKTSCQSQEHRGYRWKNSNVNFDNALKGFLPLFQVATFEGWIEVMRDAVDATKVDEQPIAENNFLAYFYFVIFIIVGSFFILNLFISVIIDNFYRLKKQYDDCGTVEVFLTQEQKQWFSTVKKALTKKPKKIIHRPKNYYQARLFDFIISAKFETLTMILIFINIILMMFQHYQQSSDYTYMLYIANVVFTIIFSLELILRFAALRQQYFFDRWNCFDMAIVILSLVGIILEYLDVVLQVTPSVFRVARVLRVGRLLRYFNSAKGIRRLLVALVISLPALLNIGALLFLILFIYAIIGMSNFGYVKKQGALNDIVNFETFGNSMLVLFRLATSAGWNEVLDSLMLQEPDCDINYNKVPNGNCGNTWITVLYFVTFILITYLIIVNMYIAVILENFNQAHEQEEIGITDEDIEMFYAVWQLYDPLATQFIEFEKLPYLVANLSPPLGIPFPNKVAVHNLDLPMNEKDQIHCIDVLQALLKRVLGNVEHTETEHYDNMRKTIDMKLQAAFPIRQKEDHKTTTMERLQQVKAATTIQKHFRSWQLRRRQPTFGSTTFVVIDSSKDDITQGGKSRSHNHHHLFSATKLSRTLSNLSLRSMFSRKKSNLGQPPPQQKYHNSPAMLSPSVTAKRPENVHTASVIPQVIQNLFADDQIDGHPTLRPSNSTPLPIQVTTPNVRVKKMSRSHTTLCNLDSSLSNDREVIKSQLTTTENNKAPNTPDQKDSVNIEDDGDTTETTFGDTLDHLNITDDGVFQEDQQQQQQQQQQTTTKDNKRKSGNYCKTEDSIPKSEKESSVKIIDSESNDSIINKIRNDSGLSTKRRITEDKRTPEINKKKDFESMNTTGNGNKAPSTPNRTVESNADNDSEVTGSNKNNDESTVGMDGGHTKAVVGEDNRSELVVAKGNENNETSTDSDSPLRPGKLMSRSSSNLSLVHLHSLSSSQTTIQNMPNVKL